MKKAQQYIMVGMELLMVGDVADALHLPERSLSRISGEKPVVFVRDIFMVKLLPDSTNRSINILQ